MQEKSAIALLDRGVIKTIVWTRSAKRMPFNKRGATLALPQASVLCLKQVRLFERAAHGLFSLS